MVTVMTRRLDRITLVCRYQSAKAGACFLGTLAAANIHAINGELKKFKYKHSTVFNKSYDGGTSSTGVSFSFSSVQKKPAISIKFTPALLGEADWVDFRSLLETMFNFGAKEVWENFKVSKLEIALDVKVPFSEMVCIAPKITEIDFSLVKDGTLYLGHKLGHRSYCIYDKRKQLHEKKKVDLDHDLTRIEVRLRSLGKTLGQLDSLTSPFGRLIAVRKKTLSRLLEQYPLDLYLKSFIKTIIAGCPAQYAYLDLDGYTRKRISKLLRTNGLNLNGAEGYWQVWITRQRQNLLKNFLGAELCS